MFKVLGTTGTACGLAGTAALSIYGIFKLIEILEDPAVLSVLNGLSRLLGSAR